MECNTVTTTQKNYQALAWWSRQAQTTMHQEARERFEEKINAIMQTAPSGSGFDNGTTLESVDDHKMVFSTGFHHMDDNGMYIGWTHHKVIVRPCFWSGFSVSVTGKDRRDIKDYIGGTFHHWLNDEAAT
jgi:hypothetical protein